LVHVRYHNH